MCRARIELETHHSRRADKRRKQEHTGETYQQTTSEHIPPESRIVVVTNGGRAGFVEVWQFLNPRPVW
jgi:hypothetical protein